MYFSRKYLKEKYESLKHDIENVLKVFDESQNDSIDEADVRRVSANIKDKCDAISNYAVIRNFGENPESNADFQSTQRCGLECDVCKTITKDIIAMPSEDGCDTSTETRYICRSCFNKRDEEQKFICSLCGKSVENRHNRFKSPSAGGFTFKSGKMQYRCHTCFNNKDKEIPNFSLPKRTYTKE